MHLGPRIRTYIGPTFGYMYTVYTFIAFKKQKGKTVSSLATKTYFS